MLIEMGQKAKRAARTLARLTTDQKNTTLHCLADALVADQNAILSANAKDVEAGRANGLSTSLIDRLMLNESRLAGMADSLRQVANLPDPVGEVYDGETLPNGLQVGTERGEL